MQPDTTQIPQQAEPVEKPKYLDASVDEALIMRRLKKQIANAQGYWEGGNDAKRKLSEQRKRNYQYWRGDHYQAEGVDLYDHNIPYKNNRIYKSIEESLRIAAARIAQPQILPGSEKETSVQYAGDLEKALQRIAEKIRLKKKMQTSARHLLTKYVGVIEFYFDPTMGREGDINARVLDPEDILISETGDLFDEPPMIDIKRHKTAHDLIDLYPHKEAQIRTKFNLLRDEDLAEDILEREYHEIWFDDYDEEGNKVVRVAIMLGDHDMMLGVMDNPHWIEEDNEAAQHNFFDQQRKPFVFINFQNFGKEKIDDNAPIDQQIPMQRIVNKRGRQIAENVEENSGGMIYNSKMISKEDMAKLIGAPDEKIGVNGDVRSAIARSTPPLLPAYVQADMIDARNQIDEMGATSSVDNGQGRSRDNTLGQAMMRTQENYNRQDALSEAVEDGYLESYHWMIQLIKVWYTEKKMIQVRGEDGQFDYVMVQSDKIEDGIDATVSVGSTAPLNKELNRDTIKEYVKLGIPIDPLTVFEVDQTGVMPTPNKMVERMTKWMVDKASYMNAAQTEETDRNAQVDIELLTRGVRPERRIEITAEYLQTLIKFITSGRYIELQQPIQEAIRNHLDESQKRAAQVLQMRQAMEMSAQKAMTPIQPEVNPAMTPPPGPPPPEMLDRLMQKGLVDENGQPTQPVGDGSQVLPPEQVQPGAPAQPGAAPQLPPAM